MNKLNEFKERLISNEVKFTDAEQALQHTCQELGIQLADGWEFLDELEDDE